MPKKKVAKKVAKKKPVLNKYPSPVIQDFVCIADTTKTSLDKSCKAKNATLQSSRGSGRHGWICECGMTFRANIK